MSASLVGSEMCIRDSGDYVDDDGVAVVVVVAYADVVVVVVIVISRVIAAVSYTHLTLPTICSV
eukprot:9671510-Alexandrium_andersonii.AAC.1